MSSFVHAALLAGLAMIAAPVLIHLINMMRHRRVRWAAMEFLLASQKKNRTWVFFKQLLLLLLRMLAIALVVLVVAQPVLRNQWGRWFGSTRTHHIVLLDDSFSMSDRWADTNAFDQAKAVIAQIADEAARQVYPQQFTLLRFSHTARGDRGTQPDMLQEAVDTDFGTRLRAKLDRLAPSQTAAAPLETIDAVPQLLGDGGDEQRVVYLVTDFRSRQWNESAELRQRFLHLNDAGVAVQLVACARDQHPNLAITGLVPVDEIRAAGVPLFIEVSIQNFGRTAANNVAVTLEEDGRARPGVTLRQIPPRETVKERFLVNFPAAGSHLVTARLESDAVAADNFRHAVIDVPLDVPVLLVDGDSDARNARFVSAALAPRGPVRSGLNPRIEPPRFLALNPLSQFRTIYLLNNDRLDRSAVKALEEYLAAGGSVVVFVGDRTGSKFVNEELYREGKGFFPMPLAGPSSLALDRLQPAPDLEVTDHPMFRVFRGQRNSAIQTVNIERYFAVAKNWKPGADSPVKVIARLRNGAPLVAETQFGQGTVIAVLTTAAPDWNNWAQNNPTFLAAMLAMQSHLLACRPREAEHPIGSPLHLALPPAEYRPQIRFVTPQRDAAILPMVDAVPDAQGLLAATLADTDRAGFYEAHLTKTDGSGEVRRYAVNVQPTEGDLELVAGPQLADRLEGVRYEYAEAASFQPTSHELAGTNLSQSLLYSLIVLLLLEQLLAWSASYHPPAKHALSPGGAA
jgi:hypothetical protein